MSENENQHVDGSLLRKAKDVTAGFIGGAAQVLIGQPADLVKIRLQTSTKATTSSEIIRSVLKNEGVTAFYKGTLPPLIGVGSCVSLQFYGFHETKRQLLKDSSSSTLNLWPQTYIAGAVAGIVNTPISAPVEQLRILSQSNTSKQSNSLTDTVRRIYKESGFSKGIYRGFGITLARETQGYGVWFLSYEVFIQQIIKYRNYKSRDDIMTPELLGSGASAGLLLWLSSYPLDVIKSNIQSDTFGASSKYNGSITAATSHIWRSQGFAGFWKGLTPCLLRAIPCSAGTFATVELALRLMG